MTNDIDELTVLNRDFVASVQNSDVRRFYEILAPEFYCSNPDKSLAPPSLSRPRSRWRSRICGRMMLRSASWATSPYHGRLRHHPCGDQLHHAGRTTGARALHRLLGEAEREMARGIGACDAMTRSRHCRA